MPMNTGTHTIADLDSNLFDNTTADEYGLEDLNEAVEADLEEHNEQMRLMVGELCEIRDDRGTVYGKNGRVKMVRADETTRAPTQKIRGGDKVEWPLDKFAVAVGWTWDYFKRTSVRDVARMQIAVRRAHVARVIFDIKNAVFGATNYTWYDRWTDSMPLGVKRFLNADGASIPNGPNGEEFDGSTHTHYNFLASGYTQSQLNTALLATIRDVTEHGHTNDVRLNINVADEEEISALPSFKALPDPRVVPAMTAERVDVGLTLDYTKADNRPIGIFGAATVWTRPWVPQGYPYVYASGDGGKPLVFRVSRIPAERGLRLTGPYRTNIHPLFADQFEAWHGIGAGERTNSAILRIGNASYNVPTFTE